MGRKENMKKMVEINRKMNDEKKRKVKTEAERLKQRAAQKEINTYKSASFQIVLYLIDFSLL